MRRKDREITELDRIVEIIKKSNVCRVAFLDEEYPYIVPLNFGFDIQSKKIILYFHCAKEGKKISLIQKNNKVCFEMDCSNNLIEGEKACDYTMHYESVIGYGTIEIASDSEKMTGLRALMKQYTPREDLSYDERAVNAVTVLKLTVDKITGKVYL